MQWGFDVRKHLQGDALRAFDEYMAIDATEIWGWGVGMTKDRPAVRMDPLMPTKIRKIRDLAFFIDHRRRSTQWAKVSTHTMTIEI